MVVGKKEGREGGREGGRAYLHELVDGHLHFGHASTVAGAPDVF